MAASAGIQCKVECAGTKQVSCNSTTVHVLRGEVGEKEW